MPSITRMLSFSPRIAGGILPGLRSFLPAATLAAIVALPGLCSAASLNVYLSAPTVQSTFVAHATTETFNSLSAGIHTTTYDSSVGQYQFSSAHPGAIESANQYGGANGSKYLAIGAESNSTANLTLALTTPANYFGFWWSAGDALNGLSFYYNNTLLTRLTTADIVNLLGGQSGHVTAIDGETYASSRYYGNPNGTNQDASEEFAYVNIIASGTGFNRIVFDNSGSKNSGFESDNHSVYLGPVTAPTSSVFVESVPSIALTVSPEPGLLCAMGLGLLGVSSLFRRRKS